MNGRAAMIEAEIGIAQAQLQYTQQMRRLRQQLQEALDCCQALQQDIAALPGAAESAGQAREMTGLCKQLETAARALRTQADAYPENSLAADLQRRRKIRTHKAAAARAFAQAGKEKEKGE